jgi:glucosamine--fructose-6-phosphate aminotransferase (isomerizing)
MCGIVAAVADRNIVPVLIEGLRKLEYRGYDSAGLAVHNGGCTACAPSAAWPSWPRGRGPGSTAGTGIAHTRWATHGVPSERNAHPHVSGGLAVVHNGIIENYDEIKARLPASATSSTSETDTEVIAHLIEHKLKSQADLFAAVRAACAELVGAYAIAVVSEETAARRRRAPRRAAAAGLGEDGITPPRTPRRCCR